MAPEDREIIKKWDQTNRDMFDINGHLYPSLPLYRDNVELLLKAYDILRKELRIKDNTKRDELNKEDVIFLQRRGHSLKQISAHYDIPVPTLRKILKK